MSTIMPKSELLRKAVTYVDERLREEPSLKLGPLLDEAGARFNLSPNDSMALEQLFQEAARIKAGE